MKRIVGLGIVAIAAIAAYFFLQGPPTVETVTPVRKEVQKTLAVTGQVEAISKTTIASSFQSIHVRRVLVDKGSKVTEGQPLIELDNSELRASVSRAEAVVMAAKANVLRAESTLKTAEAGIRRTLAQRTGANKMVALAKEAERESIELKSQRDLAAANLKTSNQRLAQAREATRRIREGARKEAVRAAQAQLRLVESRLRLATTNLKRTENLFKEGAVSQAELDVAKTNYETLSEEVQASKEQITQLVEPRTEDVRQAEAVEREAEATVEGAQTNLTNAERALKNRIGQRQQLATTQTEQNVNTAAIAASEADIRQAKAGIAAAKADLQQAIAAVEETRAKLARTILKAPVSGVITDRRVEPGEAVGPNQPLLSLSSPKRLRIRVEVDESDLQEVRVGNRAIVTPDAFPKLRLEAVVDEIVPSANNERGTVEVRIAMKETRSELLPQLTADVNIELGNYKDALTIPRDAVVTPDTTPLVKLVVNGKVEERRITLASGDIGEVMVLEGLNGNELLLLKPAETPVGTKVRTKPAATGKRP